MSTWSPNAPDTLGLEWFPTKTGEQLISGGSTGAVRFTATSTETIDYVVANVAPASDGRGNYIAEVYSVNNPAVSAVATATYRPNATQNNASNAWVKWNGSTFSTTDVHQAIDEPTFAASDWITYFDRMAQRYGVRFEYGTASWAAGRRVVGGRISFVTRREERNGRLDVYYYKGGESYWLGHVIATTERRTVSVPFPEYNPATGYPWTQAEIQELDTSTAAIRIRPRGVNKHKRLFIFQHWIDIEYVTENREAVGIADIATPRRTSGASFTKEQASFQLRDPNTGADNWTKADDDTYTIIIRRIEGNNSLVWTWMRETREMALALDRPFEGLFCPVSSYVPTLDPRGFVSTMGSPQDGVGYAFYLLTTGGNISADGQPYHGISYATTTAPANSSSYLRQIITTNTSGGTYDGARAVMSYDVTGEGSVKIVHNGSDFDWTHEKLLLEHDLDAEYDWWLTEFQAPSASASSSSTATSVDMTAVDGGADGTATLRVAYLEMMEGTGAGAAGAGGSTDDFEDDGTLDALVMIHQLPVSPTSFSGAVTSIDLGVCRYAAGDQEFPVLSWVGLSDHAITLERYWEDRDWHVVFFPGATSDTAQFTDYEARRNREEVYRARNIRLTDYVGGHWTDEVPLTVRNDGCDWIISTNAGARGAVALIREDGDHEWTFPRERVVHSLAGQDGRVAYNEIEDRGNDFILPAVLWYQDAENQGGVNASPPPYMGRGVFSCIDEFLKQDVPYICVLEPDGWRWFADVQIVKSTRVEPGNRYAADLSVIELTARPEPVVTSVQGQIEDLGPGGGGIGGGDGGGGDDDSGDGVWAWGASKWGEDTTWG